MSNPLKSEDDDLKPEYDLDYSQSRPNRFTARMNAPKTVIELEPDVAAVFQTSESVNAVLRALLATMPQKTA